ncbi:SDR family NAD(P)-dependent oxidoreductase [Streptomyces anthocyanicus]|uniref:SDR family NAD(P)-dependent oxidoreductase n=1 Tax=Streptomyces anthocyanicus TaxID=68174 RepID=UPI0038632382
MHGVLETYGDGAKLPLLSSYFGEGTIVAGPLIIGVGQGIGQAVAQRFAREGLPVALIARTRDKVVKTADRIGSLVL